MEGMHLLNEVSTHTKEHIALITNHQLKHEEVILSLEKLYKNHD